MGEEKAEYSVKVFPGDLQDAVDYLKNVNKEMKRMFPEYKKQEAMKAKMLKTKYDSLIKAGFGEDQAMWILTSGQD